ncbi:hypothetical protein MUN77_09995 [Leucobacter allii]|uniref:hypothetical protein n=1 Tax=Leucobacter allii TaxID=2932247 RepID=UPI001FD1EBFC|nr:hypothetical protein [Leucobacter allii]UOR00502.1 hypothetical protein MUN77_09995 [Leucobacter allii]
MPTITSVTGAVPVSGIDLVLAAEALLRAPAERRGNAGLAASSADFARAPVAQPLLGRLLMGEANLDDRTLDAADAAGALRTLAAEAGPGRAAVIALPEPGGAADPAVLARLSRDTGAMIVRGAIGRHAPADAVAEGTVLADRLRAELESDAAPAGLVGPFPLRDRDDRLRAAAGVAAEAGAPLVLAVDAGTPEPAVLPILRRALGIAESAGLARDRVILTGTAAAIAARRPCGGPGVGIDDGRLDALLDSGATLCFDDLGRIPTVRTVVSDHDVAVAILRAAAAGAGERILLSSGIRAKHRLTAFGGNGLEFVPQQFLPYLAVLGADTALLRAVGGGNALRILAREDPAADRAAAVPSGTGDPRC